MSRPAKITINDVGYAITIGLGEDVSAYDTFEVALRSPSTFGVKRVTCQLDPDNNCNILLTLAAGVFDEVGAWIVQPRLSTSGGAVKYGQEFDVEIITSVDDLGASAPIALAALQLPLQNALNG
jgi:hypothetical protein